MKRHFYGALFLWLTLASCSDELNCERHFLPENFTGKVTIYYNKENGQKVLDSNGCMIYKILPSGKFLSVLPYKNGTARPGKTFRYFEATATGNMQELFDFDENEYLKDTVRNGHKKYIFWGSSGYTNPDYTIEYFVDYGSNYKNY